jgi:plasmid replication initiation protein
LSIKPSDDATRITRKHLSSQIDLFLPASIEEEALLPGDKIIDMDVFVADLPTPLLRDEQNTMGYPFFSLEKSKRIVPIIYNKGDVKITVRGLAGVGISSIWDADFLIWVASQINEARRLDRPVTRRFRFKPYHFFIQTGRMTAEKKSGKLYVDFEMLMRRLKGTTVETNIKAGGEHFTGGWSWINSWAIHKDEKGKIIDAEVVISEWFFKRVVEDKSILAISKEYFEITSGIERWLYKVARKHCGSNDTWAYKLATLFEKYPSDKDIRKFRYDIKKIAKKDPLPEYHMTYEEETDKVTFFPREGSREQRKLPRALREQMV